MNEFATLRREAEAASQRHLAEQSPGAGHTGGKPASRTPPDLVGRNAATFSPEEENSYCQAHGLPRRHWAAVQQAQQRWNRDAGAVQARAADIARRDAAVQRASDAALLAEEAAARAGEGIFVMNGIDEELKVIRLQEQRFASTAKQHPRALALAAEASERVIALARSAGVPSLGYYLHRHRAALRAAKKATHPGRKFWLAASGNFECQRDLRELILRMRHAQPFGPEAEGVISAEAIALGAFSDWLGRLLANAAIVEALEQPPARPRRAASIPLKG